MSPIIPRTPVRHTSLYALFLTAALLAGVNGSTTHTAKPRTAAAGPSLTVTTLHASRDSFIRAGADDTNEGANERLHLHNSGDSRAVVSFDLTGITTAGLQSATLVLTVAEDSHTWGADGRAVDAHRLLADWAEGDGRNDVSVGGGPGTRGSGAGVTWNCAADADISDHASDCGSPWDGGLYAAATSPGVAHTNDLAGEVSWDVTADLLAGADFGWLIRKRREDRGGRVRYYSREGAAVAGDAALAPRLVLVYQTAAPAGRAYVANYSSNDVSVIDTSTNSVAATIPVGATAHAVALTPDGTRAYVANFGSHDVSVIDTTTNAVVATVAAGTNPRDIAVNSAGTRVYVANYTSTDLTVIDTSTNAVVATVPLAGGCVGVALNPSGTRAYVSYYSADNVAVIDTATNTVVGTVILGGGSTDVAVSPSGAHVYVPNQSFNVVSVIDAATSAVVTAVPVGLVPYGVAFSPSGTRAYVANNHADTVSVIDTATLTVVATVPVGDGPFDVAVSGDGSRVYVTNFEGHSLSVIDAATNTVTATVAAGINPVGVAVR